MMNDYIRSTHVEQTENCGIIIDYKNLCISLVINTFTSIILEILLQFVFYISWLIYGLDDEDLWKIETCWRYILFM